MAKKRNFLNKLFKIAALPFLLVSVSRAEPANAPLEDIVESFKGTSSEVRDNSKGVNSKNYLMRATPAQAGMSAEILVMEDILRSEDDKIEKIVLYEDGKTIFETKGSFLSKEVTNENAGTRKYRAELHTKSGVVIETEEIKVNFAGKKIDFPPYFDTFLSSTKKAGKATNVVASAKDIGDNRGIKRITLYEDGNPVETVGNGNLVRKVEYNEPQEHEYYAEAEDLGGNIIKSETIKVSYSGKAFNPKVRWFHASPEKAGKTARILVEGDDEENLDSLSGIGRIVLYEDGKQVYETDEDTLIYDITHDKSERHSYSAEIFNKNGLKTVTKNLEVMFKGEDLPPELRWWNANYEPKSNIATLLVDAEDGNNIRKDTGIKRITLYEDGNPIESADGSTLIKKLSRAAGKHEYHAEIINKSGISFMTEKKVVDYKP